MRTYFTYDCCTSIEPRNAFKVWKPGCQGIEINFIELSWFETKTAFQFQKDIKQLFKGCCVFPHCLFIYPTFFHNVLRENPVLNFEKTFWSVIKLLPFLTETTDETEFMTVLGKPVKKANSRVNYWSSLETALSCHIKQKLLQPNQNI